MKFSAYMQEWLYGEEGYYRSHIEIGKRGDFFTAVSSSMFFGGCIAKRLMATIESGHLSAHCSVVEIGAHKGYLLADIIQFIYTLKPELLESLEFVIVEPFSENQKAQRAYFEDSFGAKITLHHVKDLKSLHCEDAFFVANEIFDAFACEVVKEGTMLAYEEGVLTFVPMDEKTRILSQRYNITKGEIATGYEAFAADMFAAAKRYEFVTFDYGDRFAREDFSLRVYKNHHVYPFFALTSFVPDSKEDLLYFECFGNSDLTYDVNFDYLIKAYEKSGAKLEHYLSQAAALISFGLSELLEILQEKGDEKIYKQEINKVKTLIDPAFMGERFKMVCFRK
ncbi:SAM-dependent methyltransferase [Sulfurospirillum sp. 1612]|uniref:SAM-dependent methyltransferase n=1 Tax=Sulfurospirillum sp. 1612 TaxID=3094835 RepID=UPI002F9567AA